MVQKRCKHKMNQFSCTLCFNEATRKREAPVATLIRGPEADEAEELLAEQLGEQQGRGNGSGSDEDDEGIFPRGNNRLILLPADEPEETEGEKEAKPSSIPLTVKPRTTEALPDPKKAHPTPKNPPANRSVQANPTLPPPERTTDTTLALPASLTAAEKICSACGKPKTVSRNRKSGKDICSACYQRSRIAECAECKKQKIIQALGLCYACYKRQERASVAARPA